MDNELKELINNPDQYKDYLLDMMIDNAASDMYMTYGEPPVLRVSGKLHKINQLPYMQTDTIKSIAYMLMTDIEGEQFRKNLDIDLGWTHKNRRFRINISMQSQKIMIIIRLLAKDIPTLDGLGMPNVFKNLISNTSGIVLVAGPTGSGKSTTLAAMIEEINQNYDKHIITIEDPIEYIFDTKKSVIEQKQLGTDVISFKKALKSALRQDPDVILFGEMRDLDSIKNAITLAETGHLVLSTIHARSSSQTISKIIDTFPAEQQSQIRFQLSETLESIISQRLVRKKNKDGLAVAQEIMINNKAISNLIRENQITQINNSIQTSKAKGMQLLEEDLLDLIETEKISLNKALAYANNPDYIRTEIKSRGMVN